MIAVSGLISYHMYKGEHAAMGHDSHGDVGMGIDDVVQPMAVDTPKPRTQGYEFHISRGPRRHIDGVTGPLGRLGDWTPLGSNNLPSMAVNMDRMTVHGQVTETDPHPIPLPHGHHLDVGSRLSIKRKPVEIHGDEIGSVITRQQGEGLEHDRKFLIDLLPVFLGMDDDKAPEAHVVLLHDVVS